MPQDGVEPNWKSKRLSLLPKGIAKGVILVSFRSIFCFHIKSALSGVLSCKDSSNSMCFTLLAISFQIGSDQIAQNVVRAWLCLLWWRHDLDRSGGRKRQQRAGVPTSYQLSLKAAPLLSERTPPALLALLDFAAGDGAQVPGRWSARRHRAPASPDPRPQRVAPSCMAGLSSSALQWHFASAMAL